jgi:hypothetical protein
MVVVVLQAWSSSSSSRGWDWTMYWDWYRLLEYINSQFKYRKSWYDNPLPTINHRCRRESTYVVGNCRTEVNASNWPALCIVVLYLLWKSQQVHSPPQQKHRFLVSKDCYGTLHLTFPLNVHYNNSIVLRCIYSKFSFIKRWFYRLQTGPPQRGAQFAATG